MRTKKGELMTVANPIALLASRTFKPGDASIDQVLDRLDGFFKIRFFDFDAAVGPQLLGVEVVVDWQAELDPKQLGVDHSVKLVQLLCVGTEKFDFDGWQDRGVAVEKCTADTSGRAVAEAALMHVMMQFRRVSEAQLAVAQGRMSWPPGRELEGKRLLILGLGASGAELARMASSLGVSVRAVEARVVPESEARQLGLEAKVSHPDELLDVVQWCDVLSLHAPLTPHTRHIVNRDLFRRMKRGSVLVNTARGGLVDELALVEALDSGIISGAGLDVVEDEPLSQLSPIWNHPCVVVTPHVAANTDLTAKRRADLLRGNLDKHGLIKSVNP